jgi:hypothetical protein
MSNLNQREIGESILTFRQSRPSLTFEGSDWCINQLKARVEVSDRRKHSSLLNNGLN